MSAAVTAHISLGSNLGDSPAILREAVTEVAALSEGTAARVSDMVTSEPWGFSSPNLFYNIGVDIRTTLPPLDLLHRLQEIERAVAGRHSRANAHRLADGSYTDRYLDIDLILYGRLRLDTPELTLPHPRMEARPFVMGPLRQLRGGFVLDF